MSFPRISVLFFVAVIVTAHLFAPSEYNWKWNTISDLAAQQYPYAWIMRVGFVGFGLLLGISLIWSWFQNENKNHSELLIVLYASCVLFSGLFSTAPFFETAAFSTFEDKWHTFFASAAGFAFCIGILWHMLSYVERGQKSLHFGLFLLVMACSAMVGLAKNDVIPFGMGLIQRALYAVSFVWIWIRFP